VPLTRRNERQRFREKNIKMHSKVVVLGGGPGGYAAAFLAADLGLEVTIVEAEGKLGGTCLLRGCIPSKALLHVARVMEEAQELTTEWGVAFDKPKIALETLRARKNKVISTLTTGLAGLSKKRNVTIITARGVFEDSTTLRLEGDDPSIPAGGRLTFDHCVLASGSVPTLPPAFDLGTDRVMTSDGALELRDIPRKMLVIGGGYIGLEMATVYANLGTEVSVVELADQLMTGADRDLVKPLEKRLSHLFGGRIFTGTKVGTIGTKGDQVEVAFEGPKKFGSELYDRVLVSVGRRPNSRGLGLENTQVRVNAQGFVEVDKQQRTADPHIWAIGDVAGQPMLAHKASHEGRVAAEVIAGHSAVFDKRCIPAVVFTDPEIAWTGLTETEANASGQQVVVATYPWAASGRAQALGRTEGLTKILFDPETEVVLGVGICGPNAGDLIGEAVLAVEMGATARDLAESVHPHPTLTETLMNAAEVFYGTATEIYKPKRG
jgi:dihydrolipoamide dehydrogenase